MALRNDNDLPGKGGRQFLRLCPDRERKTTAVKIEVSTRDVFRWTKIGENWQNLVGLLKIFVELFEIKR